MASGHFISPTNSYPPAFVPERGPNMTLPASVVFQLIDLHVKPGSEMAKEVSPEWKILEEIMRLLTYQFGVRTVHFGITLHDPDYIQLMVGWEEYENSLDFRKTAAYMELNRLIRSIIVRDSQFLHFKCPPHRPMVISPLAECTEMWMLSGIALEPREVYEENLEHYLRVLMQTAETVMAGSYATVIEQVTNTQGEPWGPSAMLFTSWDCQLMYTQHLTSPHYNITAKYVRWGCKSTSSHLTRFFEFWVSYEDHINRPQTW